MEFRIRPATPEDASGLNRLRRMPGVFETILGIPSERVDRNRAYLENLDENTHFYVAVVRNPTGEEHVIGCAVLTVDGNPRRRHCGGIGLMVDADCQGQGVGRRLMETLLELADNWLLLTRVELEVFADNAKAIRLYRSLGFEEEGLLRKTAIRRGQYADELLMARIR